MSKANIEPESSASTAADEVEDVAEDQPLRTSSHEASDEDVKDFVNTYDLADHLGVLQKASLLLRHPGDPRRVSSLTDGESTAFSRESTHKWRQPKLLYFTIFVGALGAIEQGWAQTGINGANLYLPEAMGIASNSSHDAVVLGLINCGIYVGQAFFGAWLSDPVNSRVGRRGAIFAGRSAISPTWPVLVAFRLVLGAGLGLNSSSVNVYAAECAPAYIRGGLAVTWQAFTAFGIFVGFLANVALHDYDASVIWRFQLAAPLLPALPLLLLIYLCPEAAPWYCKGGHYHLAYASLARLRNTELQAAIEIYSAYLSRRHHVKLYGDKRRSLFTKLRSLFTVSRTRNALYASSTVMLSQQLCGINIIAFYSTTIFSSSGFSATAALWASVVFGFINFIGAIPAVWTMDTLGRRSLLLWTLPAMAFTMLLASFSFSLPEGTARFVTLAGLIYTFCAIYSPGMGPVPCAYSAEVYPSESREVGMSFAIFTASIWATVLSLTFPALLEGLGEQGSFALYAALNVLAWVLCWAFVRETKNMTLDEMDGVFQDSSMEFVKQAGRSCLGARSSMKRQRHQLLDNEPADEWD
ncbi:hypothetical protein LTR91_015192 [Friedmanniomyces endolithicus]|uniref:Major facilitator superfamily (MFS) profile domain-containing protein n=2 Tax=Dothideomycetidae TaxID=451867 RepID=A0AAN6QNC7_9PEZI|nr:hypothetical protein LTR59_012607 [Friedmanniomyces endolithicus]KAK0854356.1 hypothetical protein LTR03_002387 [Friedmanniomyces endolithicus]KAK0906752.1 hypothetical protein LTR57_017616 [Friedmanniomyces endolithicus]KAK0968880.1 hypothetical protein LTS01_016523 [Friedmanniomyces endolithicus]KAK0972336.1 hypothetical protein LTR91_015192 [Friedmanniomyces endolithicus]